MKSNPYESPRGIDGEEIIHAAAERLPWYIAAALILNLANVLLLLATLASLAFALLR